MIYFVVHELTSLVQICFIDGSIFLGGGLWPVVGGRWSIGVVLRYVARVFTVLWYSSTNIHICMYVAICRAVSEFVFVLSVKIYASFLYTNLFKFRII